MKSADDYTTPAHEDDDIATEVEQPTAAITTAQGHLKKTKIRKAGVANECQSFQ